MTTLSLLDTRSQMSQGYTFPTRSVVSLCEILMVQTTDAKCACQIGVRLEDSFYIDESGNGVYLTEKVGGQATSPWQP